MATFRSQVVTNTGTSIKTTGANVTSINIVNRHSAAIFVKFYNSSVATFQDTPVKVFQVGANLTYPSDPVVIFGGGVIFSTQKGLAIRVVTENTDAGNTAAATLPIIEVEYN